MATVKLDNATSEAIAKVVHAAFDEEAKRLMELKEVYEERWLDSKGLCEQLPALTPYWIKKNGKHLPREFFGSEREDGSMEHPRYMYPLNRIKRMVHEGKFRVLTNN